MKRTLALLPLLLVGCAQMGSPPGGPIDDAAPEIIATVPAADSTGVRPPYTLAITFGERVDKRSAERTLRIFPVPEWIHAGWSETTLLVETDRTSGETPDSGETITVTVSGRAKDRHGNIRKNPFSFSYTSRESIPPGRASGTIEGLARTTDAPPAIVRGVRPAASDSIAPEVLVETEASLDGAFTLRPIPIDAGPLLVLAFQDENESGGPDFDEELYGFSDTIVLTLASPSADSLRITLVNADTPASLEGIVAWPDTLDSLLVVVEAVGDTAAEAVASEPDSTGRYAVTGLPAGAYAVRLVRGDRETVLADGYQAATSVLAVRSVAVRPGEKRTGIDFPERLPEPQVTP